jgi:hypothetical protein
MRHIHIAREDMDTIYAIDDDYRRWCQATARIDGSSVPAWISAQCTSR